MKSKLNLKKLNVKSFVTNMDSAAENMAKGGATAKGGGCPTVITYGYWTYCCGETSGNVC